MANPSDPPPTPESPSSGEASPAHPFLRLMSHEMRTPLNGVIGMLGLLANTPLSGDQRAYVEAARGSADHLLGLVNDLLDFARLDAGSLEFDPAPLKLEALIGSVAELLSPRAHEKGLEIAWSVAPGAPDIVGDEGRLRQVLFNLAGNAVKFTETGGVRLSVERIGGTEARPRLAFIIDDTGPGVPLEARRRIFEEFGHAGASDAVRHDGAGLGLAVVRRLADAMGGSVSVEDCPDSQSDIQSGSKSGARFRFEAVFDAAPDTALSRDTTAVPLNGRSVAIQSPSPFIAAAARDQIVGAGGVMATSDQAEVVLIDHLTTDDGALARRPAEPGAIIMLKPSERAFIERYREAGFDGYLIKPLRPTSLIEQVLAARPRPTDRRKTSAEPSNAAPTPHDDRIVDESRSNLRVLLAEDNPVGALLARTLLQRAGCTVDVAANGQDAIAAMTTAPYDVVLMDMRMPGMDGPTATRAIRAAGDRTPIIALTANAFAEDRKTCIEAGMDDYLVKPLDAEALRIALSRWTNDAAQAKVAED